MLIDVVIVMSRFDATHFVMCCLCVFVCWRLMCFGDGLRIDVVVMRCVLCCCCDDALIQL